MRLNLLITLLALTLATVAGQSPGSRRANERVELRRQRAAARFRREFGENALANWQQRRREMRLNLLITLLALTLATVASQSPLF